jgi:hypothetical protein
MLFVKVFRNNDFKDNCDYVLYELALIVFSILLNLM